MGTGMNNHEAMTLERQAFETWAKVEGYCLKDAPEGGYMDGDTYQAYKGWQAAIANLRAAEPRETMAPRELAKRIERGEKWKLVDAIREISKRWWDKKECERLQQQRATKGPVVKARFSPNLKRLCQNCGQLPTVDIYVGKELQNHTDLCGVCTWGEAACIDPENW